MNLCFWVPILGLLAAVRGWDSVLGDGPGVSVVVEAQVDKPSKVDGGDS